MTIKIGDIVHLKNYHDKYWIGKVLEIHKKINNYKFLDPILYIRAIDKKIPMFDIVRENKLKKIDDEYWEI